MRFLVCLSLIVGALAQIPGEMHSISVRVGLLSRYYSLYVPSNWTASAPVPLVLNWHGLTDSPDGQARTTNANAYADLYGWAVAYPSGITFSHNGGACCAPAATLRIDDVSFARALASSVAGRMPIRTDAVFSMGFSNGAFMTERLACEASETFAAVGAHSGRKAFGADFTSCNPTRPIPVIAIQGTLDVLVPHLGNPLLNFPSFAQDLADMQVAMSCNVNEAPYIKHVTATSVCEYYSECGRLGVFLEYCTVSLGGHSWFTAPNIDSTGYLFMRFAEVAGVEAQPFLNLPSIQPKVPESLVLVP